MSESRTLRLEKENGETVFRTMDASLDRGKGNCLLRDRRLASELKSVLLESTELGYDLLAWVIRPNHVHLLIRQQAGCKLGDIVGKIKARSARRINQLTGNKGKLWQIGYFDRQMRCDGHMWNTIEYIHENPVTAGLTIGQRGWQFSSVHEFSPGRIVRLLEAIRHS